MQKKDKKSFSSLILLPNLILKQKRGMSIKYKPQIVVFYHFNKSLLPHWERSKKNYGWNKRWIHFYIHLKNFFNTKNARFWIYFSFFCSIFCTSTLRCSQLDENFATESKGICVMCVYYVASYDECETLVKMDWTIFSADFF